MDKDSIMEVGVLADTKRFLAAGGTPQVCVLDRYILLNFIIIQRGLLTQPFINVECGATFIRELCRLCTNVQLNERLACAIGYTLRSCRRNGQRTFESHHPRKIRSHSGLHILVAQELTRMCRSSYP